MAEYINKTDQPFAAVDQKPYIFISYAHADSAKVYPLIADLFESGYNVWYDEGIFVGEEFNPIIKDHIRQSAAFLLFVSNRSVRSPDVIDELITASENGNDYPILPVYAIDPTVSLPKIFTERLPKKSYTTISQVRRKLHKLKIQNFGRRKAEPIKNIGPAFGSEVSEEMIRDRYNQYHKKLAKSTLIGGIYGVLFSELTKPSLQDVESKETPYACLVCHPDDLSLCQAYMFGLDNAGYNVRSTHASTNRNFKIERSDCRAYVPFITRKYLESKWLEEDYKAAKVAGKHTIPLIIPTTDVEGRTETVKSSELPAGMTSLSYLDLGALSENSFIAKLEERLKNIGCASLRDDGTVKPRSFEIKDFQYTFTTDNRGIIITKFTGNGEEESANGLAVIEEPAGASTALATPPPQNTNSQPTTLWGAVKFLAGKAARALDRALDKAANKLDSLLGTGSSTTTTNKYTARPAKERKTDIVIEKSYRGHPVKGIGDYAFANFGDLKSVTIPYGIEFIGRSAFENCSCLPTVTIPDSATLIDNRAFNGCSNLTSVKISKNITSIGDFAFYDCFHLTSVTIPEGIQRVGLRAFAGCDSLTEIKVSPRKDDFYRIDGLPVAMYGNYISIDGVLFDSFHSTLVLFPPGKSGRYILPNDVSFIEEEAFYGCKGLTSVRLSDSLFSIRRDAFSGCDALTSVTIPRKVRIVDNTAFRNCNNLREIIVSPENRHFYSIDGVLFNRDFLFKSLMLCPAGKTGGFAIPDNVKINYIDPYAFSGCGNLTSVATGNRVKEINKWAFNECRGLKSVIIGKRVRYINSHAFEKCSSLSSITMGKRVKYIRDHAFSGCSSLRSITIPDKASIIGEKAFDGCSALASVTVRGTSTSIFKDAFSGCSRDLTVNCVKRSHAWYYCQQNNISCSEIMTARVVTKYILLFLSIALLVTAVSVQLVGVLDIIGLLKNLWLGLQSWVASAWPVVQNWVKTLWTDMVSWVRSVWPR